MWRGLSEGAAREQEVSSDGGQGPGDAQPYGDEILFKWTVPVGIYMFPGEQIWRGWLAGGSLLGALWETAGEEREEARPGHEDFRCPAISRDTSSHPAGSSEAGMTLQICH